MNKVIKFQRKSHRSGIVAIWLPTAASLALVLVLLVEVATLPEFIRVVLVWAVGSAFLFLVVLVMAEIGRKK